MQAKLKITRQYQDKMTSYEFELPENYPWCLDKLLDLCLNTFDPGDEHGSEAYFENMTLTLNMISSGTQGCWTQVTIKLDNNSEFVIED